MPVKKASTKDPPGKEAAKPQAAKKKKKVKPPPQRSCIDAAEADVYDRLRAPFPAEAYDADGSRGHVLTTLKAQWVRDRLSEVFGAFGWGMRGLFTAEGNGIKWEGFLMVKLPSGKWWKIPAIGHKTATKGSHYGDLYLSARTGAMSKAASEIGVGNEMFKGMINPDGSAVTEEQRVRDVEKKLRDAKERGKYSGDLPSVKKAKKGAAKVNAKAATPNGPKPKKGWDWAATPPVWDEKAQKYKCSNCANHCITKISTKTGTYITYCDCRFAYDWETELPEPHRTKAEEDQDKQAEGTRAGAS